MFFNPTQWPAWQLWEKATARMLESAVRDPAVLDMSAQAMQFMLQSKKMFDRMMGFSMVSGTGELEELRARVGQLESRVGALEARRGGGIGADA